MKQVVITGASSGIGKAVAHSLAHSETSLHLLGRSEDRLQEVAQAVEDAGGEAVIHQVDLAEDDQLEEVAAALSELGGIDVLVHSAGAVSLAPVAETSAEDLDKQYRVNLRAPYLLTQKLLPSLKQAKGQIVFINSGAGLNAKANWSSYAVSKHGLKALADSLRAEVKPDGVRVVSIYPGRVASPMQRYVHEMEGKDYDPEKFVQPEDVAQQVASVLSLPPTAEVTDLSVRPAKG